jgi:DNA-directed RNA polymerase alpha subunit
LTPIEALQLSVRDYNCLKREGLHFIGGVITKSDEELHAIRNFGLGLLNDLDFRLADHGYAAEGSRRTKGRVARLASPSCSSSRSAAQGKRHSPLPERMQRFR